MIHLKKIDGSLKKRTPIIKVPAATKSVPLGTAYAVWTGIGAAGTFIIGVLFFNDPSIVFRWIGVSLIILGVIFLKVA